MATDSVTGGKFRRAALLYDMATRGYRFCDRWQDQESKAVYTLTVTTRGYRFFDRWQDRRASKALFTYDDDAWLQVPL